MSNSLVFIPEGQPRRFQERIDQKAIEVYDTWRQWDGN